MQKIVLLFLSLACTLFLQAQIKVTEEFLEKSGFAYNPETQDGLHDADVEFFYHFGFLKSDPGLSEYDYSFVTSFQRNKLGRVMFYSWINLKTGKKRFHCLLDRKVTYGSWWVPQWHTYIHEPETECPPPQSPLWLCYENNKLQKLKDSTYSITLREKDFSVQLDLKKSGLPMPVMGTGMMGYKKVEDIHYYSYPWMDLEGKLMVNGSETKLNGEAWYDHQWGKTMLKLLHWAWWGLKLENKDAINLYFMQNALNDHVLQIQATITHQDGTTQVFKNVTFQPTRIWKSPESKRKYPVEWEISIPENKMKLFVSPMNDDHELPALLYRRIWEGPCKVRAVYENNNITVQGIGFQELIGKLENTSIYPDKK